MSETIKSVLLNYAACAFLGGMLEYIAPNRTKGALRIVVVVVLLFATLLPLVKSDVSFEDVFPEIEESDSTKLDALMHTANLTEKKIYNEMREILINADIDEYEIYVSTSVDEEENTVYLDEIKIEVDKNFQNKTEEIKNRVSEEYKEILKVGVKNE